MLIVVGAGALTLDTRWGKDRLRDVIVGQANQHLTAVLEIDQIQGSLLRGVQLSGVRLSRDGEMLVAIDDVEIDYNLRELVDAGTFIRRIRLTRPRVAAGTLPDGRWDVADLVKRRAGPPSGGGAGRTLHICSLEVTDGSIALGNPLTFGIARLPTSYSDVEVQCSFDYQPGAWRMNVTQASWTSRNPNVRVQTFTGLLARQRDGWTFHDLLLETPRSRVSAEGTLDSRVAPARLSIAIGAQRFAFQEWSEVVGALRDIAVDARFTATLSGPIPHLTTDLALQSDGGAIKGTFTLNTQTPGWSSVGSLALRQFNLARWLNRADDPSDVSRYVTFDIAMPPGFGFPRGTFAFNGSHAAFRAYEGDDVVARGRITETVVEIEDATATAYGANMRIDVGSIGVAAPYPFSFAGLVDGVDLRRLPAIVPIPHIESTLRFDYNATGQFSGGFVKGRAEFRASDVLGIAVGAGATGTVDTSAVPFSYAGEGDLTGVDLRHVGEGLNVGWLQEARYEGTLSGHFRAEGIGPDPATMVLDGGGRLDRADLFAGRLSNADVTFRLAEGSLTGSYAGQLSTIDPSLALGGAEYEASLTGSARAHIKVHDLLIRTPVLADYAIEADVTLGPSRVGAIALDRAELSGVLKEGTLVVSGLHAAGPAIEGQGSGRIEWDGRRSSQFDYVVARADLGQLSERIGRQVGGLLATSGRLTGPTSHMRAVGEATVLELDASGITARSASGRYDATIPRQAAQETSATLGIALSGVEIFGRPLTSVSGRVGYDKGRASMDLRLRRSDDLAGSAADSGVVHLEDRTIEWDTLSLSVNESSWHLASGGRPSLSWNEQGVAVAGMSLTDAASGTQRLTADGTWYPEGGSALHLTAHRVSLDALRGSSGPAPYGGTLEMDAMLTGSRLRPVVTSQVTITDGRISRTPYEKVGGRVDYANDELQLDLRLDQGPGVWLTAIGRLPAEVLIGTRSDQPMDLALSSNTISLELIEGVTSVVRDVSGQLRINVRLVGTPKDPHFAGHIDVANAGFLFASSGARYKNGRVALQLSTDRIIVEALHIEDADGHGLDVQGGLATHELRVSDLEIDVEARSFQVLRNEFGRMDIEADLALRGQFEAPRLDGRVTLMGGELDVGAILDRTLFRPYATAAAAAPSPDPIVALNPWDRLGLGIELKIPGTLKLAGDNIQVSAGTPLGLGAINLRAIGDLYLYKDPAQPLYVTGSLDSVTGTYAFQGRRFDLDPSSSINFRGDLNPELYVTVRRNISSVETRAPSPAPCRNPSSGWPALPRSIRRTSSR